MFCKILLLRSNAMFSIHSYWRNYLECCRLLIFAVLARDEQNCPYWHDIVSLATVGSRVSNFSAATILHVRSDMCGDEIVWPWLRFGGSLSCCRHRAFAEVHDHRENEEKWPDFITVGVCSLDHTSPRTKDEHMICPALLKGVVWCPFHAVLTIPCRVVSTSSM